MLVGLVFHRDGQRFKATQHETNVVARECPFASKASALLGSSGPVLPEWNFGRTFRVETGCIMNSSSKEGSNSTTTYWKYGLSQ